MLHFTCALITGMVRKGPILILFCFVAERCGKEEFTCWNGQCIPVTEKCIRQDDAGCADNSHLVDCSQFYILYHI